MRKVEGEGPLPARILIVGEAPGAEEERVGRPFVGASGQELTRILHEAGIARADCRITNVAKYRPPGNKIELFFAPTAQVNADNIISEWWGLYPEPELIEGILELKDEIERCKPETIIAFGATALWTLTGRGTISNKEGRKIPAGILSWRGSTEELRAELDWRADGDHSRVVPALHPAFILRSWEWRAITVHDLRKRANAGRTEPPSYNFVVRPSFTEAISRLNILLGLANQGPIRLAFDSETRHGYIACMGIAWSRTEAICIPFMCKERSAGYWSAHEEFDITEKLIELLEHPNVQAVWQNGLYDLQYTAHHWCCAPEPYMDTMLAHHVCWAGLPKALDFQSSMYAEYYQYWKPEGKVWDRHMPEEQLWFYNCKDCVYTFENSYAIESTLKSLGLTEQNAFQHSLFMPVLKMMLHGVFINKRIRSDLDLDLQQAMSEREQWFLDVLGHPFNPESNKQMKELFYEDFGLPVQRHRKTGNPTLDDKALTKLGQREPVVQPLVQRIQEYRSASTVLSGVVRAPLDPDGRMRCSFTIPGTETYRFSSSKNAFGRGTNLQNITAGEEESEDPDGLSMPNTRKMFIPDPGCVLIEADLEGADAQVVAWDADDEILKQMFRERVQIHLENMKIAFPGAKQVKSSSPDSPYHKTKQGVHLTNYGGGARKLAETIGITVHEAENFQRRWFGAHPAIKQWHNRVLEQLQTKRFVTNAFGFRRYYFDRVEGLLPEALAWIPQSTVAITINHGLVEIDKDYPLIQLLLQVHDSLVMQAPRNFMPGILKAIEEALSVTIPYPDPLTIPVACKYSFQSWGDVEAYTEPEVRGASGLL